MSRPWLVIALVICGVVASISMIVLGWPEDTPVQIALLELAALPLQAAVGVGWWHLSRRIRPLGSRGRVMWWIAVGLAAVGLVLVGIAYLGPRGLVHPGLALIWFGVLAAMVLVVAHLPRRPVRELFRVLPDVEEDEEEAATDEVAVDDLLGEPEVDPTSDQPSEEPTQPSPSPSSTPA